MKKHMIFTCAGLLREKQRQAIHAALEPCPCSVVFQLVFDEWQSSLRTPVFMRTPLATSVLASHGRLLTCDNLGFVCEEEIICEPVPMETNCLAGCLIELDAPIVATSRRTSLGLPWPRACSCWS